MRGIETTDVRGISNFPNIKLNKIIKNKLDIKVKIFESSNLPLMSYLAKCPFLNSYRRISLF